MLFRSIFLNFAALGGQHYYTQSFILNPTNGESWTVRRHLSSSVSEGGPEVNLSSLQQSAWPEELSPVLVASLKNNLQISAPNAIQAEALEYALSDGYKKDLIVLGQTGSGKTMAFLLPMLQHLLENHHDARCLVLAPNELLVQQHVRVANQLDPVHAKRIVFQTPKRFLEQQWTDGSCDVVALDEVDAMLYGGDEEEKLTREGKEIMLKLNRLRPMQRIATTAYLSPAHERALLDRDFSQFAIVREATQGQKGWMVPTLRHVYKYFGSSNNKSLQLQRVLENAQNDDFLKAGSTIVFCGTVDTAEQVFEAVTASDHCDTTRRMLLLHEEMETFGRAKVMEQFLTTATTITLVCTDLAARGLDVQDVRHVILYDVPDNLSAFVHQAGRTARKGKQGLLTCLVQTQSSEMGRYTKLHTLKDATQLTFR